MLRRLPDPPPAERPPLGRRLARIGSFLLALFATFFFLIMVLPEYGFVSGLPMIAGCLIVLGLLWIVPFKLRRPGWKSVTAIAVAAGLGVTGVLLVQREENLVSEQTAQLRHERLGTAKDQGWPSEDDDLGREIAALREFERREAAIRRLMPYVSERRPGFGRAVRALVDVMGVDGIVTGDLRRSIDKPVTFCATFMHGPLDLTDLHVRRVALRLEREETEKAEAARLALLKAWKDHPPISNE